MNRYILIMRGLCLFFLFLLMATFQTSAQSVEWPAPLVDSILVNQPDSVLVDSIVNTSDWDHLDIHADGRLEKLIEIQKEESLRKDGIDGFRVQIFQGTKNEAYQLKSDFLSKFPDSRVYVLFQTPDFKVRIGDFRSRSEAIKMKYMIESDFPNPFIVEDIIHFPELKKRTQNKLTGE